MDAQNLVAAITACLSPDINIRKAGEVALKQQPNYPGGLASLLAVALDNAADIAIRQVAAITLKNAVKRGWEATEKQPRTFAEGDQAAVRERLLDGVCHAPTNVRLQLEECLKVVVVHDYPNRWPSLLPSLQVALTSSDVLVVAGALRALRIVVRKYEFTDETERAPLLATTDAVLPTVLAVFQALVANPDPSLELAEMLKLCCKIFWSICYMQIPPLLTQEAQFQGWMAALLALANRSLPRDLMPTERDAREKWPWWKAKKWVYHIFNRLSQKYADAKSATAQTDVAFAARWEASCAEPVLAAVLQELSAISRGEYLAERVANYVLHYVCAAVGNPKLWKLLKPHSQDIVKHALLPLLAFNQDDAELWTEDPQEYVRKGYDVIEDIYAARTAAMTLMHALCTGRKKSQLDPIMAHVVGILNEAREAAAGGQMTQQVAWRLDGALLAIGSLEGVLKKEQRYRSQLDPMLLGYVVPLLNSSYGHLRAKAVWLAGTFADARFAEGQGRGSTFNTLLQGVVAALGDPELPVRVNAAVAARFFLQAIDDDQLILLRPLVPDLLKRFLDLSQEAPAEDITESLQTLVARFGPDLAPYAVNVMSALVQQFWQAIAEEEEDQDEADPFGGGGALAGYSLLGAMETVLDAVSSVPELYPQMEDLLFPILERYISQEGLEIFEEVTALLAYLTYWASTITPRLWTLYPRLLACVTDWARDYWEDVLPALENYIHLQPDAFLGLSDPPMLALTNRAIESALAVAPKQPKDASGANGASVAPSSTRNPSEKEEKEEEESEVSFGAIDAVTCCANLISIILRTCRGRVDHCLAPYLTLIAQQIVTDGALKGGRKQYDAVLLVFADALYYNPAITLAATSQAGTLQALFTSLTNAIEQKNKFGDMKHFVPKRAKKIVAMALTATLTLPSAALPSAVAQSLGEIAACALRVLLALKKQEEREELPFGGSEPGESEEDDSGSDGLSKYSSPSTGATAANGGAHADVDDDDEEEEEYAAEDALLRKARAAARAAARFEGDGEDFFRPDDDDDELDYWSDEDDEDGMTSPIDDVNAFVYFAETLHAVQTSDADRFAAITSRMDAGTQAATQEMMNFAMELKQAQAEKAAAGTIAG